MSMNNPENSDFASSDTPTWLSELQPASASSLQATVFYRAGYEAARNELKGSEVRRLSKHTFVSIAASLLLASFVGALLFQFGKQSGHSLAVLEQERRGKQKDTSQIQRELELAAKSTEREVFVETNPTLVPSWFPLQVSRMLPLALSRIDLLGPGVELGRVGARLDEIIVINRAADLDSQGHESNDATKPSEPQSLRALRDNQMRSLMEGLL